MGIKMKLILYINILIFLQINFISAQEYYTAGFAIIQDKDGFTNVREKPKNNSNIIYKLSDYEVFYYDIDAYENNEEWINVYISSNKFTVGCSKSNHISGYIHRSRTKPLSGFKQCNGKDFFLKYDIQKFDSSNIIIGLTNDFFVETINGLPVWGRDGELPTNFIKSIEVKIHNKPVQIHPFFYSDLYEVDNKFYNIQIDNYFYSFQYNSDGAGGYDLIWVFKDNVLVQRFVISMC
jgi:hypothetical protein